MVRFTYQSARGDTLSLTEGKNYKLVNIDGQTRAVTSISSTVIGGVDGDTANNVQAQPRTLIFDLAIQKDVEKTKRLILDVIKLKQRGKLIWEQDERKLEIEGIVESVEMPRWTNATLMQITLHCEQPFYENIDYVISEISNAISLHYFTASGDMLHFTSTGIALGEYDTMRSRIINNKGDVSVGVEIEILALNTVTNPIIYNQDGKFFGCGHGTGAKKVVMSAGDVITINTGKGIKSVKLNNTSLLGKIKPNSTWLQLEAGDNTFSINSDELSDNNMTYTIKYKQRYI